MRIFISGGCKNGKSMHAQRLAKEMGEPLYYLATMLVKDGEDADRVRTHRQAREGWGFQTIECPKDIQKAVGGCDPGGSFLLDSVTALLENAMFAPDGRITPDAHIKLAAELAATVKSLRNIVVVSDFIYSDAFVYDEPVEQYKAGLAYVDRETARACDVVLEACCGGLVVYKGGSVYSSGGF